jgi:hypothetical protein
LLRLFPLRASAALSFLSALSMVAGFIFSGFSLMSAVMPKAGHEAV